MKLKPRPFLRIAGILAGALLSAFVVLFAAISLVFSPVTALRALAWGEADVYDYRKFPSRALHAPDRAFHFTAAYDETKIKALFEADPMLGDLGEFLESTQTQAFLVIQDDRLLYEGYFNGVQRDSIVTSFSIAKSFDSALIGIAIQEGWITGVNDPITNYIPELLARDARFGEITIRDLLLMSSGIRYVEALPYGDDVRTYTHPDLRSQALMSTEIIDPPGEYFHYNNYHPLLLGIILERATGTPVSTYLQEKLWEPLGMEFDGSWSIDSIASGFEKMESGINGRAIDFAKFARLYLNLGNWDGVQVVPASWVADSIQEDPVRRGAAYYPDEFGQGLFNAASGGYYKYMWYGLHREGVANDFFASGAEGQYLYISPAKQLIIVRHGIDYGDGMGTFDWIELFYEIASSIPARES